MDDVAMPVYTRVLRHQMGAEFSKVVSTMHTLECNTCGLLYRSPYFSMSSMARLFVDGTPVHKMGWSNLRASLMQPPAGGYCAPLQLWDLLKRRLTAIERYAEFGCPFQGFLVARAAEAESRTRLRRHLTRRWRQPYLDRAGGKSALAHACANVVVPVPGLGRIGRGRVTASRVFGATRNFVVMDGTATRWGSNCVMYGSTCWQTAAQFGDVEVMARDDLTAEMGGRKLSLLAFFDTLDHCPDLAGTVRWALDVADAVLIVNHRPAEAALQHRIALTPRALRYMADSRPGWRATDLASEGHSFLGDSHHWFLLQREPSTVAA
jgi:hypothetical protein